MTQWEWEFYNIRIPMMIYSIGKRFTYIVDGNPLYGDVVTIRFDKAFYNQPAVLLKLDSGYEEWGNANYPTLSVHTEEH